MLSTNRDCAQVGRGGAACGAVLHPTAWQGLLVPPCRQAARARAGRQIPAATCIG
jgi:hypothetical protein